MTQQSKVGVKICPKCNKPAPFEQGVRRIGDDDYHTECSEQFAPKNFSNDIGKQKEWLVINGHI